VEIVHYLLKNMKKNDLSVKLNLYGKGEEIK